MDASFLDGLPKQHDGLRRRLLDGSGGQQMQIQSLGQQTGMNMVQVPQGVNASDVLRALQDHPGIIPDALCTRQHTHCQRTCLACCMRSRSACICGKSVSSINSSTTDHQVLSSCHDIPIDSVTATS